MKSCFIAFSYTTYCMLFRALTNMTQLGLHVNQSGAEPVGLTNVSTQSTCYFQRGVWCFLAAESDPLAARQQCRGTSLRGVYSHRSVVWNFRPTYVRRSVFWFPKTGTMTILFVQFYYPRDAMLARVIEIATCLSVRLSVRHAPVLCQNEES